MYNRRQLLLGTAVTPFLMGKASQPASRPTFPVPGGACDCHTHIFGDPAQFPFAETRTYTPEPAGTDEMAAMHRVLKLDRVVIVTPSVYGTDNATTLYGIKARGKNARGVAVIGPRTTAAELDALHRGGIRGIRINAATSSSAVNPEAVRQRFIAASEQIKGRPWHIQIYANTAAISAIKDLVMESPVPVVFDHFGGAQASLGLRQPGFSDLLSLVNAGKAYVKISCAYRASTQAPEYLDVTPLAHALIAANAERILWGTDWPHPDSASKSPKQVSPLLQVDDGLLLNLLLSWAPDPQMRKRILVENPARLYGF